ncbi:MAG TPA: hypothetical protein VEO00_13300, partial [Actinomycetota bacterium]|nr:hypothetical protein [Actinomycetota bacterium]
LPVALGPDDHTFVDELQLGAFAVPGRDEVSEPWLVPDAPWRPVMRTFTSDGERTIVLERDRGPFWPAWHPPAPSPKYRSSRLGITTGPDDPLH